MPRTADPNHPMERRGDYVKVGSGWVRWPSYPDLPDSGGGEMTAPESYDVQMPPGYDPASDGFPTPSPSTPTQPVYQPPGDTSVDFIKGLMGNAPSQTSVSTNTQGGRQVGHRPFENPNPYGPSGKPPYPTGGVPETVSTPGEPPGPGMPPPGSPHNPHPYPSPPANPYHPEPPNSTNPVGYDAAAASETRHTATTPAAQQQAAAQPLQVYNPDMWNQPPPPSYSTAGPPRFGPSGFSPEDEQKMRDAYERRKRELAGGGR